jgi:hypothetical protein
VSDTLGATDIDIDGFKLPPSEGFRLLLGDPLGLGSEFGTVGVDGDSDGRELNIVFFSPRGTGARVRLASISGSLVRNSTVEGVILRNRIGN